MIKYNRLICTHKRSYREFPLYITVDEHMPPEHLYYKEVNSKDGNYYRRWASAIGPAMSELIDRLLKSSKHEEQSYNACAGILHKVKTIPKGAAEEVPHKCIEINSCKYFTFKQMLKKMNVKELPEHSPGTLPNHENIRGNPLIIFLTIAHCPRLLTGIWIKVWCKAFGLAVAVLFVSDTITLRT